MIFTKDRENLVSQELRDWMIVFNDNTFMPNKELLENLSEAQLDEIFEYMLEDGFSHQEIELALNKIQG